MAGGLNQAPQGGARIRRRFDGTSRPAEQRTAKDREQQGKNQKDWGKVKDKVRDIKD